MALALATALLFLCLPARAAAAQPIQDQQQQKQPYTLPEYNALQAARAEKDPQQGIKMLDAFVAQYPNSTLMPYVYQQYIADYSALKDYAKVMEYADKTVALGDKADAAIPGLRLTALDTRVRAFYSWYTPQNAKAPEANDQLTKARDAALLGAKLMESFPKPANTSEEAFAETKKKEMAFFDAAAAYADVQLKDDSGAIAQYKAAITADQSDTSVAAWEYQIGLAQLALTPPQTLDGFWSLARAIDLKMPQADQVKEFLHARILAYEQPGCVSQVDAQLNEMLQLAANSPDRPATYTIPSQDDLSKIRNASNILTIIADLSGGGDNAKMTWLAVCGSELPEVVGKIIDVQKSDNYVDFMVFTAATPQDMQAGTTANMDVKVWTANPPAAAAPASGATGAAAPAQNVAQPDVLRLQKDDGIKFSGTLVSYDPSPFLLHWDQVKVDPSVIPAAKPAARRPARKTTHR